MKSDILGIAHGVGRIRASADLAHGVKAADLCIYDTISCFVLCLWDREA